MLAVWCSKTIGYLIQIISPGVSPHVGDYLRRRLFLLAHGSPEAETEAESAAVVFGLFVLFSQLCDTVFAA